MIKTPFVFRLKEPQASNTLYLDRDGVLNEAVIRGAEISSPRNLHELNICNDIDSLARPNIVENWNLVIITNQPDISRKLINLNFILGQNLLEVLIPEIDNPTEFLYATK